MSHNQRQDLCAPPLDAITTLFISSSQSIQSQSAFMKEAEYPVSPNKPQDNDDSQSYNGYPFDTPQSDTGSLQPAKHSGVVAEDHRQAGGAVSAMRNRDIKRIFWDNKSLYIANRKLRLRIRELYRMNDVLKRRVNEPTAACDDMNEEKIRCEEEYGNIASKLIVTYASNLGLNPDDLTSESAGEVWDNVYVEAETSKHLQAQFECLKAQTEALRNDLMASRSQCQLLEEQRYYQEAKLQESRQKLKSCQDEAWGLRTQMQALQKELLAQVPTNEVFSDEIFSRDFRALASLVKSLSRSVQSAQGIDVLDALKPYVLLRHVPKHHWDTRARKKAYVEAWIWSVLIDTVFKYSFGFSESLITLHNDWTSIFGDGFVDEWPKPTPESEIWRSTTMKKLVEEIGQGTITVGNSQGDNIGHNKRAHCWRKEVLTRREEIAYTIRSPLEKVAPTPELSYISDIVDKAFGLALNMSTQRFRVQVTWPDIGDTFKADLMTPVPDRNGEDIHGGVVASIVNPGLTRWGNTHGQNFDICHGIVPSLVELELV